MFGTNRKVDRDGLVKVLMFCYGGTVTVRARGGECCAFIAALYRLQVICTDETVAKVSGFIMNEATTDVRIGAKLLINMQQYPECTSASFCTLDQQLVKVILSKERMRSDYEIVVDGCLMKLPAKYLDVAQFEKAHTKLNEFTLRSRYVRYHSGSLNQREKGSNYEKMSRC